MMQTNIFGLRTQKKQEVNRMVINYSDQPVKIAEKSIFLAGPTPRKNDVHSWRPDACKYLQEQGFDGVVYVPELSSGKALFSYDNQIVWEWEALEKASLIVFWIPRNLINMPAFTTNVEFGYYVRDSKVLYGRPDTAESNRYLDRLYKRHHKDREIYNDLQALCNISVYLLKNGLV